MAPEKQVRINSDHTQTIKIVMYSKVSRFRASLRHGGQGVFFSHRATAGTSLRGRRNSSYMINRVLTSPLSIDYYSDFHRKRT
jgi:hypothetical protein